MVGMRLGGIDPSILRELSGVYKPFVKALKELISNAFDADADYARVEFSDDFSTVTVIDDGNGMTPFEFRNDFTRIGGGGRRWTGEKTTKGRLRIGSKGIGFLALARYCGRLKVESAANRSFQCQLVLPETPATIDLSSLLGVPIDQDLLRRHLVCEICQNRSHGKKLKEGQQYRWKRKRTQLSIDQDVGPVTLNVTVDCKDLAFKAALEFERLLRLADQADLEKLEDFAAVEVYEISEQNPWSGTRVTAEQLKSFVRRDLRVERRKGFVRNVSSRGGFEQFLWYLSRDTPVPYIAPIDCENEAITKLLSVSPELTLSRLEVFHGKTSASLRRPIYPLEKDSPTVPADMLIKVDIDEGGLRATGFLAGYTGVIFPAEFRGISIRVRGVSIGDPGFLGAELLLTGAHKAALSQVTGEINILSGLDAVDTLNPGRESFYEESEHYKILRRRVIGDGERVGGYLGRVVAAVLRRSQVRSTLTDILSRVALRRRALEDISAAITHLIARGDNTASMLRKMLKSKRTRANGLASARVLVPWLPPRVGGLAVVLTHDLAEPAVVDYEAEEIKIDRSRLEQERSLLLFDRRFAVIHKKGRPDQPIAEVDLKEGKIFINWGHPVQLQMDERGFLRTSLAWVLAKQAANRNPDLMMDLALQFISFTTTPDG